MNEANIKAWVQNLRTTTLKQGKNHLCEVDPKGGRHFCCLGVGSKQAGVPHQVNEETHMLEFGDEHADNLAPYEFMVWLGLVPHSVETDVAQHGEPLDVEDGYDVHLDYPYEIRNLRQQGKEFSASAGTFSSLSTAASLNDSGFTFAQIADMIDYFGLRRME